jgi:hypothetical protein
MRFLIQLFRFSTEPPLYNAVLIYNKLPHKIKVGWTAKCRAHYGGERNASGMALFPCGLHACVR